MPSITLVQTLKQDFPDISFIRSDTFRWSPDESTIFYANTSDKSTLLHEVAHMALGHTDYTYDIDLLKMERDAWSYTLTTLARSYKTPIDPAKAEDMLDTYRDWLHDRSSCPACKSTGVQVAKNHYKCLACQGSWRVNEARSCALRRYKIK